LITETNLQYGRGDGELFPKVPSGPPTDVPEPQISPTLPSPVNKVSEQHEQFCCVFACRKGVSSLFILVRRLFEEDNIFTNYDKVTVNTTIQNKIIQSIDV
jgi:hypothetical protein